MPSFLVESFLSRADADARRDYARATAEAAEALTRAGTPIQVTASIYVPEDEICLIRFDATSASDVELVAERAGLRLLRVVEAMPSDGLDAR